LESPIYTTTVAKMSQATFEEILTVAYGTDGLVEEFKKLHVGEDIKGTSKA